MRELRTTERLAADGVSRDRVRWALKTGRWTRIIQGVVGRGPEPPSKLDIGRATALVTDGISAGCLSAALRNFDGVRLEAPEVIVSSRSSVRRAGVSRRDVLPPFEIVGGVKCMTAPDTLYELAAAIDDVVWEQALEFCLRTKQVTLEQLVAWQQPNTVAARRVRRVRAVRGGLDIPPTESLLETLAVQLLRQDPSLPTPTRQFAIYDEYDNFVGRPDLCWPELGVFLELDGQQHKGQPVYDARRQTRIAIATSWLCGRLTWDEVHNNPKATLREIADLLLAARALPTTVS